MDRRERLRRCYFNEELDRPGVYVRDGYPEDDPTYDDVKAFLEEHSELKYRWRASWPQEPGLATHRVEPHSQDFERHVTTVHTPAGDLGSSRLESLRGLPGLEEEHLLKGPADARKYLSLPEPEIHCDVSGFFERDRMVGKRGIAETQLGLNPAGTVAALFGSEAFAMVSATDREIVHELCLRKQQILSAKLDFLLANDVGPFFAMLGQEYVVPPLHGPKDFYDFNVKYDKPIIDHIHESGGRVHVHSHGSVKQVFQGFLDMGADVLHPLEAPPMGDITPTQAKQMAGGRLCLEGNIQIADMYDKNPDDIREQTEKLIREAFDEHKGLIVCPTASLYMRDKGHDCFEQVKAMVQTVLDFGPRVG